jgi:hypothetical protein
VVYTKGQVISVTPPFIWFYLSSPWHAADYARFCWSPAECIVRCRLAILHSHILHVNVNPSMHVIEQIPADMIWVFVHDEIIAAIPTPVDEEGPIPGCHFEIDAAGEPEPMTVSIDSHKPVRGGWTKMIEMAMGKRTFQAIPRIVRRVVPVPLVVVDMRRGVYTPIPLVLFPYVRNMRRRWWGKVTLIGTRCHLLRRAAVLWCCPMLRHCRCATMRISMEIVAID